MRRIAAKGDNFDTDDRIFRVGSAKVFIFVYILWNASLAVIFVSLNLCTEKPISVIFALPFIGTCFIFIFALNMKSKLIFGALSIYTIFSLGNSCFRLAMGLSDGNWFERCFVDSVESFQSSVTILHTTLQVMITVVLIRISFCEVEWNCCCCNCCFFCCFCFPCFEEKRNKVRRTHRKTIETSLIE